MWSSIKADKLSCFLSCSPLDYITRTEIWAEPFVSSELLHGPLRIVCYILVRPILRVVQHHFNNTLPISCLSEIAVLCEIRATVNQAQVVFVLELNLLSIIFNTNITLRLL